MLGETTWVALVLPVPSKRNHFYLCVLFKIGYTHKTHIHICIYIHRHRICELLTRVLRRKLVGIFWSNPTGCCQLAAAWCAFHHLERLRLGHHHTRGQERKKGCVALGRIILGGPKNQENLEECIWTALPSTSLDHTFFLRGGKRVSI